MNNFFIGMCICFLLIIIFIGLLIFVIYKRKKDIKEIGKTIWNNLLIIWNNLLRIIVIFNVLIIVQRFIFVELEEKVFGSVQTNYYSMIIWGVALIIFISILLIIFNKKISKNKIIMFFVLLIYFLICYITPVYNYDARGHMDYGIVDFSYENCYGKSLYEESAEYN